MNNNTSIIKLLVVVSMIFMFQSPRVTTVVAADSVNQTPLFVFGDSLYDSGMAFYSGIRGAGAEFWPYGDTFFKKPVGRYSDGRVIPDWLAQFAGLPFPEPYLKPDITDYSNGINFAAAGACALVHLRPRTLYLESQINYFRQMIPKLEAQVGKDEAKTLLSKAVYLVNIGGNDFVTLFKIHLKKTVSPALKQTFINEILGNITLNIKTIYKQGGRKFAFQNVGPLGCMPSMKYMLKFKGDCHQETQEIATMHNNAFDYHIKQLATQLPGFTYSIYDFHSAASSRFSEGHLYGFKVTRMGCCGSGDYNGDLSCQRKDQSFSVCSNYNDYLWFDASHPTDKANQQFAQEFWSGSSNLVYPINLQTLFSI